MKAHDYNAANGEESEIDHLIRKLRRNAMEDLIVTALGRPCPELTLQAADSRQKTADEPEGQQSVQDDNRGLREFVARWLKSKKRPHTGEYFERVMTSVSRQLAEPHAWGFRYLDMEPA